MYWQNIQLIITNLEYKDAKDNWNESVSEQNSKTYDILKSIKLNN